MKPAAKKPQRCAIYTRVSTENGLEQEFNSLHAGRSGDSPVDLLSLSRPRVVVGVAAGLARARDHNAKANPFLGPHNRWSRSHQWAIGLYAAQPDVPW